nr:ribonuclease H-like domain-containing protein [Tanacetum cinerariifolium]
GNLRELSGEEAWEAIDSFAQGQKECIAWDKVDNPCPQSNPQVLPSIKVYTPPVTYLEEVEETIGIPMEEITHKIAYKNFSSKTKTEFSQSVETASRSAHGAVSSSVVTTSGFS